MLAACVLVSFFTLVGGLTWRSEELWFFLKQTSVVILVPIIVMSFPLPKSKRRETPRG